MAEERKPDPLEKPQEPAAPKARRTGRDPEWEYDSDGQPIISPEDWAKEALVIDRRVLERYLREHPEEASEEKPPEKP